MSIGDPLSGERDNQQYQITYPGVYRAFVKESLVSSDARPQIRVFIPNLHDKDAPKDSLPLADYCAFDGGGPNYGAVYLPDEGDTVWVMFEQGNPDYPVVMGTWYGSPSKSADTPSEAQDSHEIRLYKSRAGHLIIFDDRDGQEKIILKDRNGNTLTIATSDDNFNILANKDINMNSGKDTVLSAGGDLQAICEQIALLEGVKIQIGENSTEPVVLGLEFLTALTEWMTQVGLHTHGTVPPDPTIAAATATFISKAASFLSTSVTVKA